MSDPSAAEIPLEGHLGTAYNTIRMLDDTARRHEDEERRMRLVAQLLSAELAQLRGVFDPVRVHHTTNTWQGNSAVASRRRLDEHENRCMSTIRSLDALVDDLERAAAAAGGRADIAHDAADSARRITTG